MNENRIDNLINKALADDRELPEGLSGRLEQHIDLLAAGERRKKRPTRIMKRSLRLWLSGTAAAVLMGAAIFFHGEKQRTDTYQDPKQAALVAGQVLAFLSDGLNQGLDEVVKVEEEMEKIHQIVNEQFKHN